MKCSNCGVIIKAEYTHAIQNNQCPGCGKGIMVQAKLTAFLSLRALLNDATSEKNINVDKIASLIMANFEIKQIFQNQELPKDKEGGIIDVEEDATENNIVYNKNDPDADHKEYQMAEAKKILKLQKMRDAALQEAQKDRYGIGEENELDEEDEETVYELTDRMLREEKRGILESGAGGKNSFRRSE